MPNWGQVLSDIGGRDNPLDAVRHKYLSLMHEYTGRNVIAYYSAFIQKPDLEGTGIDDNDKNGFMQAVCGLDRSRGLDLILHTPGGAIAATESIVYYLKQMFGNDIRVFVPQIAMSAGTMIALSAKEIVMGKQSNMGPIDPQFGGVSCGGILEEFNEAVKAVQTDPNTALIWGKIIEKYHPTFLGDCEKAIQWADDITSQWMKDNMYSSLSEVARDKQVAKVLSVLSSHNKTYSHSRHIHFQELKDLGVNVVALEGLDNSPKGDCNDLQDCVLTIHHAYMHTMSSTSALKIVENHNGEAMILLSR